MLILCALQLLFIDVYAQNTGVPFKVSGSTGPFGDVVEGEDSFQITEDNRVVFISDRETNQTFELWASDMTPTSTVKKLSHPISSLSDVLNFELSPDSKVVAYQVAFLGGGNFDYKLHLAFLDTGEIDLSVNGGNIDFYDFSLEGGYLVTVDNPIEGAGTGQVLGALDLSESASNRKVNIDQAYYEDVAALKFANDNTVVFIARVGSDYRLYRLSLETGVRTEISPSSIGAVSKELLEVNASGDTVVFNSISNGLQAASVFGDDVDSLNVPGKNCTEVKLLNFRQEREVFVECLVADAANFDVSSNVLRFELDPNTVSDFITYADDNSDDTLINERIQSWRYSPEAEVFLGTRTAKQSGVGSPDDFAYAFAISDDGVETVIGLELSTLGVGNFDSDFSPLGSSVLLQDVSLVGGNFGGSRTHQLQVYNTATGTFSLLTETDSSINPFHYVDFYHELSMDPEYFIFSQSDVKSNAKFPRQVNLYRQRYSDGEILPLNASSIAGGNVTSFKMSPDGRFLVYRGDQLSDDRFELFAVEYREAKEDDEFCFPIVSASKFSGFVCL